MSPHLCPFGRGHFLIISLAVSSMIYSLFSCSRNPISHMSEMLDTSSPFHPCAFYSVDLSIAFLIRQLKRFFFPIGIEGVVALNDQG